ncbi:biotin holocarboxylase synthetase [Tulasnella sp. 418]|nr:biotin holocarboxylase synthetase [Tulasnella sp. 418]
MNVLVYDGPGVSQTSLSQTISSLKSLLYPNYSINSIKPSSLISDPWPPSCALLVIPGGRDLPYVSSLAQANPRIRDFVHNGGSFLGICAGAYYTSRRVEWEVGTPLEVVGNRDLGFFPGTAKGCVYDGFLYESEDGARAINVEVQNSDADGSKIYSGIYYNGGGMFEGADEMKSKGVRVLARYVDGDAKGKAAAVSCDVGQGRAILWGPHLEYPLVQQPASAAIYKTLPTDVTVAVEEMENGRWELLKETLGLLGLRCSLPNPSQPTISKTPLPQVLIAPLEKQNIVAGIVGALAPHIPDGNAPPIIQDANDAFYIHTSGQLSKVLAEERSKTVFTTDSSTRHVIIMDGDARPDDQEVPLFNIEGFFAHLSSVRRDLGIEPTERRSGLEWGIGEALLYGEVVTSTQTLFDK